MKNPTLITRHLATAPCSIRIHLGELAAAGVGLGHKNLAAFGTPPLQYIPSSGRRHADTETRHASNRLPRPRPLRASHHRVSGSHHERKPSLYDRQTECGGPQSDSCHPTSDSQLAQPSQDLLNQCPCHFTHIPINVQFLQTMHIIFAILSHKPSPKKNLSPAPKFHYNTQSSSQDF